MSTDTLTILPRAAALAFSPSGDRDDRKRMLTWLAAEGVNGLHPVAPSTVPLLAAALASPSLTAAEAVAKWVAFLDEWELLDRVRGGDPEFRDFDEATRAADTDAALNDICDGTSTYTGARR